MKTEEAVSQGIERILGSLGLEQKRTTAEYILPAVGIFAAGVIVGGVLGLLFAPQTGEELRGNLTNKFDNLVDRSSENARV